MQNFAQFANFVPQKVIKVLALHVFEKAVGNIVDPKPTLSELDISVNSEKSELKFSVERLKLNSKYLSNLIDQQLHYSLEIVEGYIGEIVFKFPFGSLDDILTKNPEILIRNLEVSVRLVTKEGPQNEEPNFNNFIDSMSASISVMADQCRDQAWSSSSPPQKVEQSQASWGTTQITFLINKLLTNIKITLEDTIVRLEKSDIPILDMLSTSLTEDSSESGIALELRIKKMSIWDEAVDAQAFASAENSKPITEQPGSSNIDFLQGAKIARLSGVQLFSDVYSTDVVAPMQFSTSSKSMCMSSGGKSMYMSALSRRWSRPDEEDFSIPVKLAEVKDLIKAKLKLTPNSGLNKTNSGYNVQLEVSIDWLSCFVFPQQFYQVYDLLSTFGKPEPNLPSNDGADNCGKGSTGGIKKYNLTDKDKEFIENELDAMCSYAEHLKTAPNNVIRQTQILQSASGCKFPDIDTLSMISAGQQTDFASFRGNDTISMLGSEISTRCSVSGVGGASVNSGVTRSSTGYRGVFVGAKHSHVNINIAYVSVVVLNESFADESFVKPDRGLADLVEQLQENKSRSSITRRAALIRQCKRAKNASDAFYDSVSAPDPHFSGVKIDLRRLRETFHRKCPDADFVVIQMKKVSADAILEADTVTGERTKVDFSIGGLDVAEKIEDQNPSSLLTGALKSPIKNAKSFVYTEILSFDDAASGAAFKAFVELRTPPPSSGLTHRRSWKDARSPKRGPVGPSLRVDFTLAPCHIDFDVSTVDRVALLYDFFNPTPPADGKLPVAVNEADDLATSSPNLKVSLKFESEHVRLGVRFPVPDLRPLLRNADSKTLLAPMLKRYLRSETLVVDLTDVCLRVNPAPCAGKDLDVLLQSSRLHFMWDVPGSKSIRSLALAHGSESDQHCSLHIILNQPQSKQAKLANALRFNADTTRDDANRTDTGFDFMTQPPLDEDLQESTYIEHPPCTNEPSVFSQKHSLVQDQHLRFPGNRQELGRFRSYVKTTLAVFDIDLHLPALSVIMPSKQLLELVYNRVVNDLLMWTPRRQPYLRALQSNTSRSSFDEPEDPMTASFHPKQSTAEASQFFSMCRSGLQQTFAPNDDDEEDDDEGPPQLSSFLQGGGGVDHLPLDSSDSCQEVVTFNMSIGFAQVVAHLDATERGKISTAGRFLARTSGFEIFVASGTPAELMRKEKSIELPLDQCNSKDNLHMFVSTDWLQLYHAADVDPTLTDLEPPVPLDCCKNTPTSPSIGTLVLDTVGSTNSNHSLLTVSLASKTSLGSSSSSKKPRLRENIVSLCFHKARLCVSSARIDWLNDLTNLFDLTDQAIIGYTFCKVSTHLQLHVNECDILYNFGSKEAPTNNDVSLVKIDLDAFTLKTNIASVSDVTFLTLLFRDLRLSLGQQPLPSFVCIGKMGSLRIDIELRDASKTRHAQTAIDIISDGLELSTCADSLIAFSTFINHITTPVAQEAITVNDPLPSSENDRSESLDEDASSPNSKRSYETAMALAMQSLQQSSTLGTASDPDDDIEALIDDAQMYSLPQQDSDEDLLRHQQSADLLRFSADDSDVDIFRDLGPIREDTVDPDHGFYIVDEIGLGHKPTSSAPEILMLLPSGRLPVLMENHFETSHPEEDLLRAPDSFPKFPELRVTVKRAGLKWSVYDGRDFPQISAKTAPSATQSPSPLTNAASKPTSPCVPSNTTPVKRGMEESIEIDLHSVDYSRGGDSDNENMDSIPGQFSQFRDLGIGRRSSTTEENLEKISKADLLVGHFQGRRDLNTGVCFEVERLMYRFESYAVPSSHAAPSSKPTSPESGKSTASLPSSSSSGEEKCVDGDTIACRHVLHIKDINVCDRVRTSAINKLVCRLDNSEYPRRDSAQILSVKMNCYKVPNPIPGGVDFPLESEILMSLLPLKINLHSKMYDFVRRLATNLADSSEPASGPSPQPGLSPGPQVPTSPQPPECTPLPPAPEEFVVRKFKFSPDCELQVDFVYGFGVDANVVNDCPIYLKKLYLTTRTTTIQELIVVISRSWQSDIQSNQLLSNVIRGIGPASAFGELWRGVRDLVTCPITQYREEGDLKRGVKLGASSFREHTLTAVIGMTATFFRGIEQVSECLLQVLTSNPIRTPQAVNVGNGPTIPTTGNRDVPSDFRQGCQLATEIVRQGITNSKNSVIRRAEVGQWREGHIAAAGSVVRALPANLIVQPIAVASQAVVHMLDGARHQLQPDAFVRYRDKYKHSSTTNSSTKTD